MADWFRKTTWTTADESDFRKRLARSRKRDEYLRIQALTLVENGLAEPSLRLLDELLVSYHDDFYLAQIQETRAQALVDLGRPSEAIEALTKALEAQRAQPNVQGFAALAFAELVLALGRRELFRKSLALLDELHSPSPFPAIRYREAAVRALLHCEL